MNIAVIGTGYVGLVTGTCFAENGNNVMCIDIDSAKVDRMRNGTIPIYEPGLEDIFLANIASGNLQFTNDLQQGIAGAEIIFLALPTPSSADGQADLSYIQGVADQLGSLLQSYTVIVNKSTVPVGAAADVRQRIAQNYSGDFDVVSNPEFLREGFAVQDFIHPDRVVIGSHSAKAIAIMTDLYQPFVTDNAQIIIMDEASAEMTKYAANSFLALKVSFMNEMANLCEVMGANVDDIKRGIGSDERIGKRFLNAGIGFGGSCFPKDVLALRHMAAQHDYTFRILEAVVAVNTTQKRRLVQKIMDHYANDIAGKHFALWGLAFKPDTDDIRESPALEIINALIDSGATVTAYDPEAMPNVAKLYENNTKLSFADDQYAALKAADALLIATEWQHFSQPDFERMHQHLNQPVIFDGRNLYQPAAMAEAGFDYKSIGRKPFEIIKEEASHE